MPREIESYNFINEIDSMKYDYPFLESKPDYYVFSALFIKASFYKNPERVLTVNDIDNMIVDGSNDCGIDILLKDPNSEGNDLIIGQSKYSKTTSYAEVLSAVRKMADGYKDLLKGHYELANERLGSRFADLHDNIDKESSKICFVFYTSAPKPRISAKQIGKIEKIFREQFIDTEIEQFINTDNIEIKILFAANVKKEIKDATTWKPIVESGKINIDKANNCLRYGDNAAIVNVSALSIKRLYYQYETNLLSLNLRYHIAERKRDGVDNAIKNTIENNPASFWLKNNGITIICDDFRIDGREVHLKNFSIVNGGQTTWVIHKNNNIDTAHDFYLPCKIIRNTGETKEEKTNFSLEIAQATNSQKPITQDDLKANTQEQISFASEMRSVGVFYQIKRGGDKPSSKEYPEEYHKTKLEDVGKLCMAAIFQMPCVSRNKKSLIYKDKYYDYIFKGEQDKNEQEKVAKICKELLYINYYYNKIFKPKFKNENETLEDAKTRLNFATNARTSCIAFVALAARWYYHKNITDQDLNTIFAAATSQSGSSSDDLYKAVRDINSMQSFLLPKRFSENMDLYEAALDKLFSAIIEEGVLVFSFASDNDSNLNANRFFQNDRNYYTILKKCWSRLKAKISEVFADV